MFPTRMRLIVALFAGVLALSCGEKKKEDGKGALRELAEAAVPEDVGRRDLMEKLLSPQVEARQLSEAFDFETAAEAVKSADLAGARPTCEPSHEQPESASKAPPKEARCRYEGPGGAVLKTRLAEGRITFLDRNRSFQASQGVDNEVPVAAAVQTALATLVGFGVPRSEIDTLAYEPRELMVAAQPVEDGRAVVLRAEVHALFAREVAGTPVFNSEGHVAIGSNGDPARVHVRWRDFCLTPGLSASRTLDRSAVVDAVASRVGLDNAPEAVSRLDAYVAYVSARDLQAPGETAPLEADDDATAGVDSCYVPALVVTVHPKEAAEDSGEISEAGQLVTVPLLGAAAGQER